KSKIQNLKSKIERAMLIRQSAKKSDGGLTRIASRGPRLHSVQAMLRGKQFTGGFQIGGSSYELIYAPATASIVGRRLQLQGPLTVKDSRGQTRMRERVRAT